MSTLTSFLVCTWEKDIMSVGERGDGRLSVDSAAELLCSANRYRYLKFVSQCRSQRKRQQRRQKQQRSRQMRNIILLLPVRRRP